MSQGLWCAIAHLAACGEADGGGPRFLIVTNGDNEYDPRFLEALEGAPGGANLVAVDFYSRYQRPTAAPCIRFAREGTRGRHPHPPPCKENLLRLCHTDTAALAWDWHRLLGESWLLSTADVLSNSVAADARLAEAVIAAGWKVRSGASSVRELHLKT
jgi:hypothetical protein